MRISDWSSDVCSSDLPVITVITLLVLGLMLWAMLRYRAQANPVPSKTTHNTFIEIIWTAIPVLILSVIAVSSLRLLVAHYEHPPKDEPPIKVTGSQWRSEQRREGKEE